MKKIKIIGLLFCGFSFALGAQVKLNVEGDTKITGKLELLQAPNNFSIFIGTNAGQNDSGDNHSTFIGYNAGLNNTANDNTFLGYQAGEDNTVLRREKVIPNLVQILL